MTISRGTYAESSFSHDEPTEHDRLRALEEASDPHTFEVFAAIGVRPDWTCAEVGAGAGSVAGWLAAAVPDGRVVATDLDTAWLDADGHANLEVLRHDITTEDLPQYGYQLIHCRALMVHLPAREQVIARLVAALAPGGWLVIEDPCIAPVRSETTIPAYRRLVERSADFVAAALGTDLLWPLTTAGVLADAGLESVATSSVAIPFAPTGAGRRVFDGTFRQVVPPAVAKGFVTAEDAETVRALYHDPAFTHPYLDMMAAWGRRPTSDGTA